MPNFPIPPDQQSYINKLNIAELVVIFEALQKATDSLFDIVNQPRCTDNVDMLLNELLHRPLGGLQLAVIDELRKRMPKTEHELALRNECLAEWEIRDSNYSEAMKMLADIRNPLAFRQQ